jgi:hypothetical protein
MMEIYKGEKDGFHSFGANFFTLGIMNIGTVDIGSIKKKLQ